MGGPGKAFLLPHRARSAQQPPLPLMGAKGMVVKPEGLPFEQQWAPEADEMCLGERTRGPRTLTDIFALNLNSDRERPKSQTGATFFGSLLSTPEQMPP